MRSTHDGKPATIAELYLLDAKGKHIDRTKWQTHYISSETLKGNHTADKAFDLQESTYWQAEESDNATLLVIDLGQEQTANAVEYLQMTGNHSTGRVKDLSIYMY